MRQTGFQCFPEAAWGVYLCLYYENKADLLQIIPTFFASGLRDNELCLWVTWEPLEESEAWDAMKQVVPQIERYKQKNQFKILSHTTIFFNEGFLDLDRALQAWGLQLEETTKNGYDGLRLAFQTPKLSNNNKQDFLRYEKAMDIFFSHKKILALCAYSLQDHDALETINTLANRKTIFKSQNGWELFRSAEAKRGEAFQRAQLEILSYLAESDSFHWGIRMVILNVLEITGFQVGTIWLSQGEDYTSVGYNNLFGDYVTPSWTCQHKNNGLIYNQHDDISRDCVFTSTSLDHIWTKIATYTPFGSFYKSYLDGSPDESNNKELCARCVEAGIKTVMLVPIKAAQGTIGYFRLNDRRADILHLSDNVSFLEGISYPVGYALKNLQDRDILARSESLFRLLADNSRDIIYRVQLTPQLQVEYISPALSKLTGYEPHEFRTDGSLAQKMLQPLAGITAEESKDFDSNMQVTTQMLCKDGRVIWLEQYVVPVFDDEGRLAAVEGIARDVTDRLETVKKLRSSHDKLRILSARVLKAQEEERSRLSREMHDNVGQALTTLKIELQILTKEICELSPDFVDRIAQSIDLVDTTMDFVHLQAVSLRPPVLDDMGLAPAVRNMADDFSRRTGIPVKVKTKAWLNKRLSNEVETALFRCVQEALTNVVRHARAGEITVAFSQGPGEVFVQVRDDGIGFEPENIISNVKSIGLIGMQERIELINGTIRISSQLGVGTQIDIKVPF